MSLAVGPASFRKEALSLQVLLAHLQLDMNTLQLDNVQNQIVKYTTTHRAVEALTVVVVRQSLHPAIARFHREAARKALGRKQLVPVRLAVRLALLEEERTVAEQLAAIRAREALRMEMLADGVQTVALKQNICKYTLRNKSKDLLFRPFAYLNLGIALVARRRQILLEAVLAVQFALLLHEANVLQRTPAILADAHKVIRTPDLAQGRDERTPLLCGWRLQKYVLVPIWA